MITLPNLDSIVENGLKHVVVQTGAGVSAASGIPTFRGAGGLYNGDSVEDLATPEGFAKNPQMVWEWYAYRIGLVRAASPNPGHFALAKWQAMAESFTLLTSNVDDLHERAGSPLVHHLHGTILKGRCSLSGSVYDLADPLDLAHGLPFSPEGNLLRPDVVWFGERPVETAFEAMVSAIPQADLYVEVGHSGVVQYGFSDWALSLGIPFVRINPDRDPGPRDPRVIHIQAGAEEALPALVEVFMRLSGEIDEEV